MSTQTRYCGCVGCSDLAAAVIDYNGKRRTVCESHVNNHPVVERI